MQKRESQFGLGLRSPHYNSILEQKPKLDFFEVITENYLSSEGLSTGRPRQKLELIRKDYPIIFHGVSLSPASEKVSLTYLKNIKELFKQVEPLWVSDHFCYTGVHGINTHDLLPVPYTEASLKQLCQNIDTVQNYLNRPLALENVSSYLSFTKSEIPEWEFISETVRRTGCKLLLDINNVYVSSHNHGFCPKTFIKYLPKSAVIQYHLAGHSFHNNLIVDTHDEPVPAKVLNLYAYTLTEIGPRPTMIERDQSIPPFQVVFEELQKLKAIEETVLGNFKKPTKHFSDTSIQSQKKNKGSASQRNKELPSRF